MSSSKVLSPESPAARRARLPQWSEFDRDRVGSFDVPAIGSGYYVRDPETGRTYRRILLPLAGGEGGHYARLDIPVRSMAEDLMRSLGKS